MPRRLPGPPEWRHRPLGHDLPRRVVPRLRTARGPVRHLIGSGRIAPLLLATALLAGACVGADGEPRTSAAARSLYTVGDSWAELMHDQVRVELDDRDFTEVALRPFGVGGSTMRGWSDTDADPMRALLDTLVEDPAPEPVVLLTLGGNDLLDAAASADRVRDDLRRVVSALADARDDVIVVLASYDVVNPAVAPAECRGVFEETLGVTDIADITGAFRRQWAALEATAADLDPVVTVDAFGTLQGRPGDPDVTSPSSVEYLQDCLHLNDDGHDLYLDEVFDQALTPVLCRTEDAAVCGR